MLELILMGVSRACLTSWLRLGKARSSCGCNKDAFFRRIGQIDLVKGAQEGRSKEDLEADRRVTQRVLLRAVAYKAVSLAWPSVVSTKKMSGCHGVAVPLGGGDACLSWRRKWQSRTQALRGAVFRHASKPEGKTKRPPKA